MTKIYCRYNAQAALTFIKRQFDFYDSIDCVWRHGRLKKVETNFPYPFVLWVKPEQGHGYEINADFIREIGG